MLMLAHRKDQHLLCASVPCTVADLKGGGLHPARAPPTDQNFFNFIGFSENITKILDRRPT